MFTEQVCLHVNRYPGALNSVTIIQMNFNLLRYPHPEDRISMSEIVQGDPEYMILLLSFMKLQNSAICA